MNEVEVREIVVATVEETMTRLGIEHEDPIEMQKDFQHLREWRESATAIKKKGTMTVVGVLITGILTAAWFGLKDWFNA